MDEGCPCDTCDGREWCDGWEATYCCQLCIWQHGGEPDCKMCDPMDI